MGDITGSHKRSRHNSVVDAEKLRSRLDSEQNFHEIQSLIDENFSEKFSRRKVMTAFVDPVVNLNMCILRSRVNSQFYGTSTETASVINDIQKSSEVQRLNEELAILKQRDAVSRSLELKVDLKV
jgi:hypothetical protein